MHNENFSQIQLFSQCLFSHFCGFACLLIPYQQIGQPYHPIWGFHELLCHFHSHSFESLKGCLVIFRDKSVSFFGGSGLNSVVVWMCGCVVVWLCGCVVVCMGAIWWGTRGTCPPTFSGGGDIICHVPPLFSL